ncbi:glycosyltransferase [uncultured Brachybacterium sp.]|uniref:glycosyltransferase n=1 Tax=uncultured Brachybacterium sp. TaxID=189680 RepID=UPI00262B2E7A|nr:glycosyltransferase [uncultured Brachybacterium sp.]
MHALLIPSWYPRDADDPSGTFFREQAEILASAGHRITVLAAEITAPDPRKPASIRPALARALRLDEAQERGVRVLRLRLPVPLPGIPGPAARALAALALRVVRSRVEDVDVVHAHSVHPGAIVARAVARDLGVPWLLTEHRPSSVTATRRPRFEAQIRSAIADADLLSAVSDGLSRVMEQRYSLPEGSVQILSNPVSADLVAATSAQSSGVQSRSSGDVTRFVHLSHLAGIKRVDDLILAFRARGGAHPSELVIAGGRPEQVREIAARHGTAVASRIPDRGRVLAQTGSDVVLVGRTRREDVPLLLATADRFVLASAQESFGIVLAESLCMGVPVIATDTWGARDVIADDPDRGVIVPVGDVRALTAAMDAAVLAHVEGERIPVPGLREDTLARYSPASYAARAEELWLMALADGRSQNPRAVRLDHSTPPLSPHPVSRKDN